MSALTHAEHATVIAGLRAYREIQAGGRIVNVDGTTTTASMLQEIASDAGAVLPLTASEIEALIAGPLSAPAPFKIAVGEQGRVAVISTAHLTLKDSNLLESGDLPFTVASHTWGSFVGLLPGCDATLVAHAVSQMAAAGLSASFVSLWTAFREDGYAVVQFDAHAGLVSGFPSFDW